MEAWDTTAVAAPAPVITLTRSDRMSAEQLLGFPGTVYGEPLEVRAVDENGDPLPNVAISWEGFGSPRGAEWDPVAAWRAAGEPSTAPNDEALITRTDANGHTSVDWKLGTPSSCQFSGYGPMYARVGGDPPGSVRFDATMPDLYVDQGLAPIPVELSAVGSEFGGRYDVDLTAEWLDPLGGGYCGASRGNVRVSFTANRRPASRGLVSSSSSWP